MNNIIYTAILFGLSMVQPYRNESVNSKYYIQVPPQEFNPRYPVHVVVDANNKADSIVILINKKLAEHKFKCINEDQYKKMIEEREKEIYRRMDPEKATDLEYILNLRRSGPTFLQTFWVIAEFEDNSSGSAKLSKLSYKMYNHPDKAKKMNPLYSVPIEQMDKRYALVVDSLVESLIRNGNAK